MQASSSTKTSSACEENSAKGDQNSGEEEHVQIENQSSSECVAVALEEEEVSEVRQVKTVELPEEEASTVEVESEIEGCSNCGELQNEVRMLRNQVKSLQGKLGEHRKEKKMIKRRLSKYFIYDHFTGLFVMNGRNELKIFFPSTCTLNCLRLFPNLYIYLLFHV